MHVYSQVAPSTDIRLRPATGADWPTVAELITLVDLHRPSEEIPAALQGMRLALQNSEGHPLSRSRVHFLIAETADSQQVGLAITGIAQWMLDAPSYLQGLLTSRYATLQILAVRPDFRRHGIARALLQQTEQTFKAAGYKALMLRHGRSLTSFYRKRGYTTADRVSLLLPAEIRLTLDQPGWRQAFKILSPSVSTTKRQGHPAIIDRVFD